MGRSAYALCTLLVLGLILAPPAAEAKCFPRFFEPPDKSDVFIYLDAVIDSLGWVKQGRSRIKADSADFGDLLLNVKTAQADYRCGADSLAFFTDSSDEMIRASAPALILTYEALADAHQKLVNEIVSLLDQASRGQQPGKGTMLDRITTLGVATDEVWKAVPLAVIGATYALPKYDDKGKPTGRFRISRSQRQQLLRALEKQFGPSVRGGMQVGQHRLEGAAGALYGFLADRKWRSADEP